MCCVMVFFEVWCAVMCCVVVWVWVWCGVVWCGVVWCGVVWCGVVWCGVVPNLRPQVEGTLAHSLVELSAAQAAAAVVVHYAELALQPHDAARPPAGQLRLQIHQQRLQPILLQALHRCPPYLREARQGGRFVFALTPDGGDRVRACDAPTVKSHGRNISRR